MANIYHVTFMAPDCERRIREQQIYVQAESDIEAREVFYMAMPEGRITGCYMAGDWGPETLN